MLYAEQKSAHEDCPLERPRWEVADIFRTYGKSYRQAYPMPPSHLKVMHAVMVCRTGYLGGHIEECDSCGFERNAYNSCRNRHCPKCQALVKAKWLKERTAELLPVEYFHNVFTLPHELNPIVLCNKRVVFDILFQSVSETLLEFGRNPDNGLGGKLGFIAILHTWSQTLLDHFHLHCVIPAGALSLDETCWLSGRKDFLFPVKALSKVFRGKFTCLLKKAYEKKELLFPGNTETLGAQKEFSRLVEELKEKDWVVYSKKPFAGPKKVLDYLGRYTHRVAISNHRIVAVENGRVSFQYRDRKDKDTIKIMTIEAIEFIRRFLLHVIPDGFMRIRHYGFLANRCKNQALSRLRMFFGLAEESREQEPVEKTLQELMLELTGININKCPKCNQGIIRVITELPVPSPESWKDFQNALEVLDSS